MRLGFQVDAAGKVPVKVVARTFASGKTEKLIYQAFSDLGLPSEKVMVILIWSVATHCTVHLSYGFQGDSIDKADFTFEKFVALYHKICPRNDIEELFQSM